MRLKTGDWVEITTFRPKGKTYEATGERLGSAKIPVFVTEGIHPRVLAVSNSVGYFVAGRAATGKQAIRDDFPGYVPTPQNDDLSWRVWWDPARGGRGNGYNINAVLPIQPAPVSGMQAWYDTVCEIQSGGSCLITGRNRQPLIWSYQSLSSKRGAMRVMAFGWMFAPFVEILSRPRRLPRNILPGSRAAGSL